jgi:hypothetical protein
MRNWVVSLVLVAVLVASLVAAQLKTDVRRQRSNVPVVQVRAASFVHRVMAEGNVRAVQSTTIVVPAGLKHGHKIAWIADEGSEVKAGDAVVRFDPTWVENRYAEQLAQREIVGSRLDRATGQSASMSISMPVPECCMTCPFSRVSSVSFEGSGISSAVTIQGPSGEVAGKFFPVISDTLMKSRTEPSQKHV